MNLLRATVMFLLVLVFVTGVAWMAEDWVIDHLAKALGKMLGY